MFLTSFLVYKSYEQPFHYTVIEQLSSPTSGTVNVTSISYPYIYENMSLVFSIITVILLGSIYTIISCARGLVFCCNGVSSVDNVRKYDLLTEISKTTYNVTVLNFITIMIIALNINYNNQSSYNWSFHTDVIMNEQTKSIIVEGSNEKP